MGFQVSMKGYRTHIYEDSVHVALPAISHGFIMLEGV